MALGYILNLNEGLEATGSKGLGRQVVSGSSPSPKSEHFPEAGVLKISGLTSQFVLIWVWAYNFYIEKSYEKSHIT